MLRPSDQQQHSEVAVGQVHDVSSLEPSANGKRDTHVHQPAEQRIEFASVEEALGHGPTSLRSSNKRISLSPTIASHPTSPVSTLSAFDMIDDNSDDQCEAKQSPKHGDYSEEHCCERKRKRGDHAKAIGRSDRKRAYDAARAQDGTWKRLWTAIWEEGYAKEPFIPENEQQGKERMVMVEERPAPGVNDSDSGASGTDPEEPEAGPEGLEADFGDEVVLLQWEWSDQGEAKKQSEKDQKIDQPRREPYITAPRDRNQGEVNEVKTQEGIREAGSEDEGMIILSLGSDWVPVEDSPPQYEY